MDNEKKTVNSLDKDMMRREDDSTHLLLDFLSQSRQCKRARTISACQRIAGEPTVEGIIDSFCRQKGHGWIIPNDKKHEKVFLHISDIEEDWVPEIGDQVTFKRLAMPPRNERFQAVCVHYKQLDKLRKAWNDTTVN
ncbi:hypothetical protein GJ496_000264 [Pomphorhynchus laevis]|nr:hypothetical protein GJ496_000264 [Pomphorhynchus laevis]